MFAQKCIEYMISDLFAPCMSDDDVFRQEKERQTSLEILEEYREACPKRRFDMWFMFKGLRDRFDESERANYQKNDAEALTWFRSL